MSKKITDANHKFATYLLENKTNEFYLFRGL